MGPNALIRQVLREFHECLHALYGPRLRNVILFGSYARGDAEDGSDIDLVVVLDDFQDAEAENARISPIASELSLNHDVLISCMIYSESEFRRWNTPLLLNVRREGVLV